MTRSPLAEGVLKKKLKESGSKGIEVSLLVQVRLMGLTAMQ